MDKLCQNLHEQFQKNFKQFETTPTEIQTIIKQEHSALDVNNIDNNQLKNLIKSIRAYYQKKQETPPNIMTSDVSTWSYNIVIDSKDRDYERFTRPNNYIIDIAPTSYNTDNERKGYISRSFQNVVSVELLSCFILNTANENDANTPPYLILEIPELLPNLYSTNDNLSKGFTILTTFTTQGNYRYFNVSENGFKIIKNYEQRISIPKLTIIFRKPDGSLYDFGNNNNSNTNTVNCLVFKVTVMKHHITSSFLYV